MPAVVLVVLVKALVLSVQPYFTAVVVAEVATMAQVEQVAMVEVVQQVVEVVAPTSQ